MINIEEVLYIAFIDYNKMLHRIKLNREKQAKELAMLMCMNSFSRVSKIDIMDNIDMEIDYSDTLKHVDNDPDLPAFTKEGIIIILFKEDGVDAVRTCVGNHLSFEFSSFFQDKEKVYSESASIRAKYNTTKMGEVDGFHSVDEIEENPRIVLFVFE